MRTMWEINQAWDEALERAMDPETGEILDTTELEAIGEERDAKLEAIALKYKNELAFAEALKTEKQKLAERQQQAEKRADSLKRYLDFCLGGEKFQTAKVRVSYRKSTAVQIAEGTILPEKYTTVKTEIKPDKTALKKAIQEGEEIAGVELVESRNISVK